MIKRWILEQGSFYTGFDFNVRIGTAIDPGSHLPDSIRQGSIKNTQKRIDCVAFTAGGLYIVEGKIIADITVWGQFEGYKHIVNRDFPDQSVLGYVLVAHSSTPDSLQFLRSRGVTIFVYPSVVAGDVAPLPE